MDRTNARRIPKGKVKGEWEAGRLRRGDHWGRKNPGSTVTEVKRESSNNGESSTISHNAERSHKMRAKASREQFLMPLKTSTWVEWDKWKSEWIQNERGLSK